MIAPCIFRLPRRLSLLCMKKLKTCQEVCFASGSSWLHPSLLTLGLLFTCIQCQPLQFPSPRLFKHVFSLILSHPVSHEQNNIPQQHLVLSLLFHLSFLRSSNQSDARKYDFMWASNSESNNMVTLQCCCTCCLPCVAYPRMNEHIMLYNAIPLLRECKHKGTDL